jgi:hypothetical protein
MNVYDEAKHPRGKNLANTGQYSPKDHAEPEEVELGAAPVDSSHLMVTDDGHNTCVSIRATGNERNLDVCFDAPGDATLVTSVRTPDGRVHSSTGRVPFPGTPADFHAVGQGLCDATLVANDKSVPAAQIDNVTHDLRVSIVFDKTTGSTDITVAEQGKGENEATDAIHVSGDPRIVLNRLASAWDRTQDDWETRGDEDDTRAWETFGGWSKPSDSITLLEPAHPTRELRSCPTTQA